jgi:hypothetical protein
LLLSVVFFFFLFFFLSLLLCCFLFIHSFVFSCNLSFWRFGGSSGLVGGLSRFEASGSAVIWRTDAALCLCFFGTGHGRVYSAFSLASDMGSRTGGVSSLFSVMLPSIPGSAEDLASPLGGPNSFTPLIGCRILGEEKDTLWS